jgi:GT2 family glycosyltransferase
MKPLLMVMNPRTIPQCMEALEALQVDKVWLKNWTERELVTVIADVVANTDHDVIGLISDDTTPLQECLDLVLQEFTPDAVFTGYCNMDDTTDDVNLSSEPLVVKPRATYDCYTFPKKSDVDNHSGLYRSWFTGFAMTFMSRDMWLKYPFDCIDTPGYQSDYRLSVRLQQDGVPIWAVPGAFMQHWRGGDESTRHLPGGQVIAGGGRGTVVWDI